MEEKKFEEWLDGYIDGTDATSVLAKWVSDRSISFEDCKSKNDYIDRLKYFKIRKDRLSIFETVWREYQRWVGEYNVVETDNNNSNQFEAKMYVSKTIKDGINHESKSDSSEELLEVGRFVTTPAQVSVKNGMTIGLSNYSSFRIDVGVKLPCYKEEVDLAYERAIEWTQSRIEYEVVRFQKDMNKKDHESIHIDDLPLPVKKNINYSESSNDDIL